MQIGKLTFYSISTLFDVNSNKCKRKLPENLKVNHSYIYQMKRAGNYKISKFNVTDSMLLFPCQHSRNFLHIRATIYCTN